MSPALPSEDDIRRRAHEIWVARGMRHGCALDDWLAAEREFAAESAPAATVDAAPPLPAPLAPSVPVVVPTVPPPFSVPATKPAAKPAGKGKGSGKGKGRAKKR